MFRGRALTLAAPTIPLPTLPPPLEGVDMIEATDGGSTVGRGAWMEALAMERRERTRSSG